MDLKTILIVAGAAVLLLNPSLPANAKTFIGELFAKFTVPKLAIPSGNAAQTLALNPAQDAIATNQKRHGLNIVQDLADALIDNAIPPDEAKSFIDPLVTRLVVYRKVAA